MLLHTNFQKDFVQFRKRGHPFKNDLYKYIVLAILM